MARIFQWAFVGIAVVSIAALSAALVLHFVRGGGGGVASVPEAFRTGLTFAQAQQAAKETGKPVLVFVTADWCGPCQKFKRGTLSEIRVRDAVREKTIAVYLDADKDSDTAASLKVFSIPALLMVRADGVVKLEGVQSAERVLAFIDGK